MIFLGMILNNGQLVSNSSLFFVLHQSDSLGIAYALLPRTRTLTGGTIITTEKRKILLIIPLNVPRRKKSMNTTSTAIDLYKLTEFVVCASIIRWPAPDVIFVIFITILNHGLSIFRNRFPMYNDMFWRSTYYYLRKRKRFYYQKQRASASDTYFEHDRNYRSFVLVLAALNGFLSESRFVYLFDYIYVCVLDIKTYYSELCDNYYNSDIAKTMTIINRFFLPRNPVKLAIFI